MVGLWRVYKPMNTSYVRGAFVLVYSRISKITSISQFIEKFKVETVSMAEKANAPPKELDLLD